MAQSFTSVCTKHVCLQLYVKVEVVVPMLSQVLNHENVDGSGGIAPCIINLSTIWMWVVSFTPQMLYTQGRAPGTHSKGGWMDTAVENRKSPCPTGSWTAVLQPTV